MDTNRSQGTTTGSAEINAKLPIEEVFDLHPQRPRPVRLNPRSVFILLSGLTLAITLVVIIGLKLGSPGHFSGDSKPNDIASRRLSDKAIDLQSPVSEWADTYAFLQQATPPPVAGEVASNEQGERQPSPTVQTVVVPDPSHDEVLEEMLKQMREGFDSPVVFTVTRRQSRAPYASGTDNIPRGTGMPPEGVPLHEIPLSAVGGARAGDLLFLRNPGRQPDQVSGTLRTPASPYELRAGSVIPAALITAIHSDLPGDLVGQVTQDVYDAETAEHLLIPQGSRLIGTYRNELAVGQNRVLVVWQRLILPNGKSIGLDSMPGVDLTGAAGLQDKVDYHLEQIAGATALSSVIALSGNLARGLGDQDEPISVVGETVAQQSARFGQQVIDRQLSRPPTITVRAGQRFNVLVNRDIPLEPYQSVRSWR